MICMYPKPSAKVIQSKLYPDQFNQSQLILNYSPCLFVFFYFSLFFSSCQLEILTTSFLSCCFVALVLQFPSCLSMFRGMSEETRRRDATAAA